MIKKGSTDVTDYIVIRDSSDGTVETGVTIADLDLQYVRNGAAPSAKVDAVALAATDTAHTDNRMIEIDATDQPGLFRVDWPDAAFASGVDQVVCTVKGTGFDPIHKEYQLVDFDPEDAVRLGLTALPNAAADGAGGLPISDAGGLALDTKLANTNEVTAARMGALTDWINGGRLDTIIDAIVTHLTDVKGGTFSGATDSLEAIRARGDAEWVTGSDTTTGLTLHSDYDAAKTAAQPGADGDTLETLSDQLDLQATAEALAAISATSGGTLNYPVADDNVDGALNGVTFLGVETSGTYASTEAEDGTVHKIDDSEVTVNSIDIVYQFNLGGNRTAAEIDFTGYLTGSNDEINIQAYDHVGSDWETMFILTGTALVSNQSETIPVYAKHTSSTGVVYVRFVCAGQSSPQLNIDRLMIGAINTFQSVGYANGAIWVKATGTAGAVDYVNGTADNPCPLANAITIGASLGITRFHIVNGETITLTDDSSNRTFEGNNWTLDLNGQAITNAYFEHATVSGTATGTGFRMIRCKLAITAELSVQAGGFKNCVFGGNCITLSAAGNYFFKDCSTGVTTACIDLEDANESKNVFLTPYDGDLELKNFGHGTATHLVSVTGQGHLTLNANCDAADAGDVLDIHGMFNIIDSVIGSWGGTINEDARVDQAQILGALTDDDEQIDASALNTLSSHDPGDTIGTSTVTTAQVNTEVDNALNTAIPDAPTADSINAYIQAVKYAIINKIAITEADGNTVIYKDNDSTEYCSVAAAYSTDSTTTTRKRLE